MNLLSNNSSIIKRFYIGLFIISICAFLSLIASYYLKINIGLVFILTPIFVIAACVGSFIYNGSYKWSFRCIALAMLLLIGMAWNAIQQLRSGGDTSPPVLKKMGIMHLTPR